MQEITSLQNNLVKQTVLLKQKKNRTASNLFLIEGFKGVKEALNSGLKIDNIFIGENFIKELDIPDHLKDKTYKVTEHILDKIASTDTAPDIIATAYQKHYELKDIFKTQRPIILVLENIKDPGNLGTIIRTAIASNVSGIILTDETVDLYSPKTVRASAFNIWKIPVVKITEKATLKQELNKFENCKFAATRIKGNKKLKLYSDIDYNQAIVLMFGSESHGISDELVAHADYLLTIPMNNQVESLNLSVSTGVIMYEAFKQRNFKI